MAPLVKAPLGNSRGHAASEVACVQNSIKLESTKCLVAFALKTTSLAAAIHTKVVAEALYVAHAAMTVPHHQVRVALRIAVCVFGLCVATMVHGSACAIHR